MHHKQRPYKKGFPNDEKAVCETIYKKNERDNLLNHNSVIYLMIQIYSCGVLKDILTFFRNAQVITPKQRMLSNEAIQLFSFLKTFFSKSLFFQLSVIEVSNQGSSTRTLKVLTFLRNIFSNSSGLLQAVRVFKRRFLDSYNFLCISHFNIKSKIDMSIMSIHKLFIYLLIQPIFQF